jgi:hypothetical protein
VEREAFLPVGRCRSVWLRLEWIEPVLLGKGGRVEREALPWCCQSSSYLIQPLHILSSTYEEPSGQPIERRRFASNTPLSRWVPGHFLSTGALYITSSMCSSINWMYSAGPFLLFLSMQLWMCLQHFLPTAQ